MSDWKKGPLTELDKATLRCLREMFGDIPMKLSGYDNGEHYGERCWCILDYEDKVVERDEDCKIHEVKEE